VNSNEQDDRARVAAHAREFGIPFPVLKDDGTAIADRFGAERVPEVFVLDAGRTVRYRGRIDDQFEKGLRRAGPTRSDLAGAHGRFANDRRLPDAEREALLAWIDGGRPEGDPAVTPPPKPYVEGWSIGKPDEVFVMNREVRVPDSAPKTGLPYRYLLAGEPFK